MDAFPVTNGVTTVIAAPDGYVVDFANPQEQFVIHHFLIFGLLGFLAVLCLAQRLYTKQFLSGGLQIEDGMGASLVMQSVQTWSISIGGLGHHAWEMPIEVFANHNLSSYIVAPIFIACNGLSKTSLLAFYLRISPQKSFKIVVWSTMAMVAGYTTTIAGLLLFGCRPIRTAWDPYVVGGRCVDQPSLYIAIAVANIVSDCILFVIPIPTVAKLKMPLAQKIGAGFMFGVGSMTVATSIVRMVYLPSLLRTTDIPWAAAPANVWSFVEVNLFIICGSMPTLRKFLKRFAPKLMGSSHHSSTPGYYAYNSKNSNAQNRHRTGYTEFDGIEMENNPNKMSPHVDTTSVAHSDSITEPQSDGKTMTLDNNSKVAILT
ncbi:hypothetical protein B0I35DRAFT_498868 [Stachybotrys elegans]|uniref:Rhodopsin domain-containing protein n=1 Tax=Stachybotrys elegans TaxID=80388 RepID=A0A8K0SYG3_9HYPO|nr:hypothetical protein B0I35DRAFT_498868 [Stachybotrys elegans]